MEVERIVKIKIEVPVSLVRVPLPLVQVLLPLIGVLLLLVRVLLASLSLPVEVKL